MFEEKLGGRQRKEEEVGVRRRYVRTYVRSRRLSSSEQKLDIPRGRSSIPRNEGSGGGGSLDQLRTLGYIEERSERTWCHVNPEKTPLRLHSGAFFSSAILSFQRYDVPFAFFAGNGCTIIIVVVHAQKATPVLATAFSPQPPVLTWRH